MGNSLFKNVATNGNPLVVASTTRHVTLQQVIIFPGEYNSFKSLGILFYNFFHVKKWRRSCKPTEQAEFSAKPDDLHGWPPVNEGPLTVRCMCGCIITMLLNITQVPQPDNLARHALLARILIIREVSVKITVRLDALRITNDIFVEITLRAIICYMAVLLRPPVCWLIWYNVSVFFSCTAIQSENPRKWCNHQRKRFRLCPAIN